MARLPMLGRALVAALAADLAAAAAVSVDSAAASPTPTEGEACARVSATWAAQKSLAVATPTVAASVALECLESVPLYQKEASDFVESIEPYLEWQSDAAYKKNPPSDYPYPPYDIFANIKSIKDKLSAGEYKGEYAFQKDLYETVFAPGHDGHFVLYPDALSRALRWRRQRSLVSISEDGKSLPVIKLYEDVMADAKTARVVDKINGIQASKYVEDTIGRASYNQDADAAYNSMFFSVATNASAPGLSGYFSGGGRISLIYQGPNTTFTFDDGTTTTTENQASITGNWDGVVDGPSFYQKFCTVKPASKKPPNDRIIGNFEVPGYPEPVIATSDGVVSGYYLTGEGLDDVAVISLLGFASSSPEEFQAVCHDFFTEARAAGKTKLVVDFQSNGGGYILQGYDFFRQLFPRIQEDGFSRWKGNPGFITIADVYSAAVAGIDPATSADAGLVARSQSWFNYRQDLNLTLGSFSSFDDKFAPHVFEDTPYTAIMRWNLSDPLTTTNETFGFGMEISGYGNLTNLTQPFHAEDIVMLYDGVCASTCTIASEMLRLQGHVKSVAFGGRPREGLIQGVGGVKGSQVLSFDDIYTFTSDAARFTSDPEKLQVLGRYNKLAMSRSTASAVNVRDQVLRGNVDDGLPAQFVTEEADCRLYWTAAMLTDVREIWKAAARAAFNGAPCAYGGLGGYPSARRRAAAPWPVAPWPTAPRHRGRRSDLVRREPVARSQEWLAMHLQQAIE